MSEHQGRPGAPLTFEAEVHRVFLGITSEGALRALVSFQDDAGNRYVWLQEGDDPQMLYPRDRGTFVATVFSHEEHPRFGKTTVLTNVRKA